jgi:hypothetical protein
LVHCWELAGGSSMSNLLEIPLINSRIIQFFYTILFINSPKIQFIFFASFHRSNPTRNHPIFGGSPPRGLPKTFGIVGTFIGGKQSAIDGWGLAEILENSFGYFQDKRVLRPLGIPFVVVCARYDEFQVEGQIIIFQK